MKIAPLTMIAGAGLAISLVAAAQQKADPLSPYIKENAPSLVL